jgi:hypothetical protein
MNNRHGNKEERKEVRKERKEINERMLTESKKRKEIKKHTRG